MKKLLLALLVSTSMLSADFFQEEDKQKHMAYSAIFGSFGGMVCRSERAFNLRGWKAILCGTAIGMIPGLVKEGIDQKNYGGWDNRDLAADAIGSFAGSLGTVTIWEFSSGNW